MEILEKISIKNVKLNKKRTISTIIGIILSCSLICAVATMATSFQATLVENAINETGYYHLKISGVTDDDIKKFSNNRDIKDIHTIYENGYGKLENSQNEDKPYLRLYSMEKEQFENLKFNLIEGNFPSNENEILVSRHLNTNGKLSLKVGDILNLDVGKRMTLDDNELNYSNPYNSKDEKISDTKEHSFKIVRYN